VNKDLLTFIELCLIDGAISEKERKVIFAKAKELGVGKDECDVLIESLTQKKSKTITKPTIKKREFEPKTIISIPPAPLNNENKLNSYIKSNNERLLSLSKQEAEEIKKIKQSNQEIVDKINALRIELESFQKKHNEKKTYLIETYKNEVKKTLELNNKPKDTYVFKKISESTELSENTLKEITTLVSKKKSKGGGLEQLIGLSGIVWVVSLYFEDFSSWIPFFVAVFFTALGVRKDNKATKKQLDINKGLEKENNEIRKKYQPKLESLISDQDLIKKAQETITHITKPPATPINIS
tara:strand:- start:778 stop:1668 length:891 start_codon:yes stop_codon:yes gene_type:complete